MSGLNSCVDCAVCLDVYILVVLWKVWSRVEVKLCKIGKALMDVVTSMLA